MPSRALIALAFLVGAAPAPAQEVSRGDARAIRAVISEQLDAFAKDDAKRAFSLATAGIRARFGTPEVFIEMVRTEYPVVYRPRSVRFEEPVATPEGIVQPVRMSDADGRFWMAHYPMQRESGKWRTNGCYLVPIPGRGI